MKICDSNALPALCLFLSLPAEFMCGSEKCFIPTLPVYHCMNLRKCSSLVSPPAQDHPPFMNPFQEYYLYLIEQFLLAVIEVPKQVTQEKLCRKN